MPMMKAASAIPALIHVAAETPVFEASGSAVVGRVGDWKAFGVAGGELVDGVLPEVDGVLAEGSGVPSKDVAVLVVGCGVLLCIDGVLTAGLISDDPPSWAGPVSCGRASGSSSSSQIACTGSCAVPCG
jgi:hypothetical protein